MTESIISKIKRICQVEGCDQEHHAKNYCNNHYRQFLKHGKILKRTMFDSNEFIIEDDICRIKLYDREGNEKAEAIVDVEDYEKIKDFKWRLGNDDIIISSNGKLLHHVILDFKFVNHDQQVDHKNGDRKINRKFNLRICDNSENNCNCEKYKNNTSGYKGVSWDGVNNKWRAQIRKNNKVINIGRYKTRKEAAMAYNRFSAKYHKNFAYQNTI